MIFWCIGLVGDGAHARDVASVLARAGAEVRVVPWGRRDGAIVSLADGHRGQLEVHRDPQALYGCDLVIEQVDGGLAAQREAVVAIERSLSRGAILGVSTRTSPIDGLAAVLRRPEQALGLTFPAPVDGTDHVEVAPTERTAPGVYQGIRQLCRALGRRPLESMADAAE